MRRDISSSLGEGSCDTSGMEELRGENPLSAVDAVSGKGGLGRGGMVSISNRHERRNRRVQRGTFVQVDVVVSSPRWV